jgi:16S rRNA U516 pseudouridylate synthase RsuA-like enzyme
VPKKYLVTTSKQIESFDDVARQFQEGLYLPDNDMTCRPSLIERVNDGVVRGSDKTSSEQSSGSSRMSTSTCTDTSLHQYYVTLFEGKRHQVKCMINAVSMHEEQDVRNRVVELHRKSVGNLILDGDKLREGEWRHLLPEEVAEIGRRVGGEQEEGEEL